MGIAQRLENNISIISINGDFDTKSIKLLQQYVRVLLEEKNVKAVVLNLKQVKRLDSSGIGIIIEQHKLLETHNLQLLLSNCNPAYVEILQMMQWDKILNLFQTEEEALASLA